MIFVRVQKIFLIKRRRGKQDVSGRSTTLTRDSVVSRNMIRPTIAVGVDFTFQK